MRAIRGRAAVLWAIMVLASTVPISGQEGQAEQSDPVMSVMLTDLASCDARGEDRNVQAIATLLQAARRLDRSNPEAAILLAESLEALGDKREAVGILNEYVGLAPEDEVALAKGIWLALETLQTSEQRRGFLSQLVNQPSLPGGVKSVMYQELSRLSYEAALEGTAQQYISQAMAADPFNLAARQKALDIMSPEADAATPLGLLTQMVRINPLRLQVVWDFANALDAQGLHQEAQKWYKCALGTHLAGASGTEITAEYWLDLGASYVLSGNYDEAMKVLDRLLVGHGQRVDLRVWLARAEAAKANKEQADKHLAIAEKVLLNTAQNNPADARAASQVAWFYLQDKPDKAKARQWSEKATELDEQNELAQLCQGLVLLSRDDIEGARQKLQPLSAANPWARLGVIRAMVAEKGIDNATEEEIKEKEEKIQQAIYEAFRRHPGGWVGLAVRELARTQNIEIPMDQLIFQSRWVPKARFAQMINAQLGDAAQLRDFHRQPQNYLHLKIRPRKPDFSYNEPLTVNISLTNMGANTISLGPGMMVNPHLVMSVKLSGGLEKELKHYDFVSLYEQRRIDPQQGISKTVRLDRGQLRQLLRQCPQETVTIRLSCILDPQVAPQDEYLPSLGGQVSKEVVLIRYGFRPSPGSMTRLYKRLKEAPSQSRIWAVMLLGDLLANSQHPVTLAGAKPPRAVDQKRIKSALIEASGDPDWRVRAWASEALRYVKLDPQLSKALAEQIRDRHWMVRLMAVRSAGTRGPSWTEILQRVAQTDADGLVRQLAGSYVGLE